MNCVARFMPASTSLRAGCACARTGVAATMQDAANQHRPARQLARAAEIDFMFEPLETLMSSRSGVLAILGGQSPKCSFFQRASRPKSLRANVP
jgi:hypothetical protein